MLPATQARQPLTQQVVVVHPVGQQILEASPLFPAKRSFRDIPFALLFLACAAVLAYFAGQADLGSIGQGDLPGYYKYLPLTWAVGLACGTVVGILFVLMLRVAPLCMVWTCLLATPATLVLAGVSLYARASQDQDGQQAQAALPAVVACFAVAAIQLLVLCCWKRYVPLTAEVLRVVAHVLLHHLAMLFVGVICAALHLAWVGLVACSVVAIGNRYADDQGAIAIAVFLITVWGLVIFRNVAYLSYCGVFGQWYFGQRVSTCGSFAFAMTKGFGPVCFGSLLIAIIALIRRIAESSRRSDNGVTRIIGAIVACLLACIEDMVEWFSSFAYVQVALRGCSFCEAARATVHLCTSANVGKICASMLSGSVTFMGCLISGCAATGASLAFASAAQTRGEPLPAFPSTLDTDAEQAAAVFWYLLGVGSLIFGFFSAGNVMKIVCAGVNTTLVCWAERPDTLAHSHAEIHNRFMGTTGRNLRTAPGFQAALV